MSRLTLRLPETLHQQLANLAEREGISLNQYIVYMGKLWFIDRMVWLYEDMKDDNSLYRSWLY